jgi:hypothetical protein
MNIIELRRKMLKKNDAEVDRVFFAFLHTTDFFFFPGVDQ